MAPDPVKTTLPRKTGCPTKPTPELTDRKRNRYTSAMKSQDSTSEGTGVEEGKKHPLLGPSPRRRYSPSKLERLPRELYGRYLLLVRAGAFPNHALSSVSGVSSERSV